MLFWRLEYHITWLEPLSTRIWNFFFYLIVALNKQPLYVTPYRNPCQRYSNIFFYLFADVSWKVDFTAFLWEWICLSPCISSYIPSNTYILSQENICKYLVLIYFQGITATFFIRHLSNYLQVCCIFWKNLLAAKYQYKFTTPIELYLHPSDPNPRRSIEFLKMTTKKPVAKATGFSSCMATS